MTHRPIQVFAVLALALSACRTVAPDVDLADPGATRSTAALYANLKEITPDHTLLGHQDDLAYGVYWRGEAGRSDVLETVGSYPAVYGWDVGGIELGESENLFGVPFDMMVQWIREGFERGGVITLSWHMTNPATGGSAWDTTSAVRTVLPGESNHARYRRNLDRFAGFIRQLGSTPPPILFRPFHDVTGGWFWWARGNATPDEFKALWRFTVHYLRDEHGLHNLLYVYSPDVFYSDVDYLEYYPGNDVVDVLGLDDYADVGPHGSPADLSRRLRMLVNMADQRGKLAALTETGRAGLPDSDWWTQHLLPGLAEDPVGRRVAYVLLWRNAYHADRPGHFFVPPADHPAEPDFRRFVDDDLIWVEEDLPNLYR